MVWLGLACLLPAFVLLAEFNLTMEEVHILLANSLDQSYHLIVNSFTYRNAHKITGISAVNTSKFKCTIVENAKVRMHKFRDILTLILQPFSKDHKFTA
jgi:hypothetical protein